MGKDRQIPASERISDLLPDGRMADAAASQVGHIPFDSQHRQWQKKGALTRPVFDVHEDKLCCIVESGQEIGKITAEAAKKTGLPEGLPLFATGSDKACGIMGLGCIDKEKAAISLGTTATVTFTIDHYLEPERFIPPYDSIMPGLFYTGDRNLPRILAHLMV